MTLNWQNFVQLVEVLGYSVLGGRDEDEQPVWAVLKDRDQMASIQCWGDSISAVIVNPSQIEIENGRFTEVRRGFVSRLSSEILARS